MGRLVQPGGLKNQNPCGMLRVSSRQHTYGGSALSILPERTIKSRDDFKSATRSSSMPPASAGGAASPGGAISAAPLGTIGKSSSTSFVSRKAQRELGASAVFLRRFMLQSAARELMPREAVAKCLRAPVPTRALVDVLYTPVDDEKGTAHYGGLQVCKSVWMCPVCAAKISERRREDLTLGLKNWHSQKGARRVLLVTFTLSHSRNDALSVVLRRLTRARSLLVSGRWANSFNDTHRIVGYVRSLEVTYGDNGWHPHLHVLYFFDAEVNIGRFEEEIKLRWSQCVQKTGTYASWQYGVDVRYTDKDVADYVAKWGKEPEWKDNNKELKENKWSISHEVTKGVTKQASFSGRSPLQLLAEYAAGDEVSGRLWLQYAVTFKGQRQLYWSQAKKGVASLRERCGLAVEKTDEELADEQNEVAIILAQLTHNEWRIITANDARGELLEVACSGDGLKVAHFLETLGIG